MHIPLANLLVCAHSLDFMSLQDLRLRVHAVLWHTRLLSIHKQAVQSPTHLRNRKEPLNVTVVCLQLRILTKPFPEIRVENKNGIECENKRQDV